ncbi:hypothetical protein H6A30_08565 [Bacteroides caecigallinarum]|uniref:hypothetical protein n=1 Tax=Bacteroides caecigallinarum TaxID=1411144 RepID=UPI00195E678C|nr:hypothetical protein [Bacteroides caecigallinarum]MBM6890318.1 hypothetical protein [Bacteroides caecigallinarum]
MKTYFRILSLTVLSLLATIAKGQFVSYNQIENGRYEATVYYSSTTGQKSTYELVVTVTNDAVTAIHFGNGGSVHSGFNNEGYTYSGGRLSFSRDYRGNITGASTTVKVAYYNGTTQYFQIEL